MIDVAAVLAMHERTVVQWHAGPISNTYEGIMEIACTQHSYNFRLWHEEDVARSREASDAKIAGVKRRIDRLNQQRNDAIEAVDEWIAVYLDQNPSAAPPEAPLNTETPGSVIDRLSILALRIYHLREQLERADVDADHHETVKNRLAICEDQKRDLANSLIELLADIQAGRKRHKIYRQLKMYNDPAMNPYLNDRRFGGKRFPRGGERGGI